MERARVEEIAVRLERSGGKLPLGFGGQASPRPAGESVGLVVAYMTDRFRFGETA